MGSATRQSALIVGDCFVVVLNGDEVGDVIASVLDSASVEVLVGLIVLLAVIVGKVNGFMRLCDASAFTGWTSFCDGRAAHRDARLGMLSESALPVLVGSWSGKPYMR